MNIYILFVERWGGQHYYSETVEAYVSEEEANAEAVKLQGSLRTCDTRYYVEEVALYGV